MHDVLREAERCRSMYPGTMKLPCFIHGMDCPVYAPDGRLPGYMPSDDPAKSIMTGSISGTTCKDHSRVNKHRKGAYGKHARPFETWCSELRVKKDKWAIQECTEDFPLPVLEDRLGDLFELHQIIFGPDSGGCPAKRRRSYFHLLFILLALCSASSLHKCQTIATSIWFCCPLSRSSRSPMKFQLKV